MFDIVGRCSSYRISTTSLDTRGCQYGGGYVYHICYNNCTCGPPVRPPYSGCFGPQKSRPIPPMSTSPAPDQDGGTSTPVVTVEPVSDTETAERSEKSERDEKVERAKMEPKLPKPLNVSHPVWKHFRVYRNPCHSGSAIRQLSVANSYFHCAEAEFKGGPPTNLMAHLDTSKAGQRDAHTAIKHAKAKGSGSAAAPAGQATTTSFLSKEEGAIWHDELVRLVVNKFLSR